MKVVTKTQERQIVNEVLSIAREIYGEKRIGLQVKLKQGGYTATADVENQTLNIRIDTWLLMNLFAKRLLIVHELLHLKGWGHSVDKCYGAHFTDMASFCVYRRIWGEDAEYRSSIDRVDNMVAGLFGGYKTRQTT